MVVDVICFATTVTNKLSQFILKSFIITFDKTLQINNIN